MGRVLFALLAFVLYNNFNSNCLVPSQLRAAATGLIPAQIRFFGIRGKCAAMY